MNYSPVFAPACPFLRYVCHRKVEHFEQRVVCRKYCFGFRYFAELTVKSLYGVCCVYEGSHFLRVFEVGAQVYPVVFPGSCCLGVFLAPFLVKSLQIA